MAELSISWYFRMLNIALLTLTNCKLPSFPLLGSVAQACGIR